MNNFDKMIEAIGTMGEVSAIYYQALVHAGLPEDHAIILTAKVMGELMRAANIKPSEEDDKHE